LLSLFGVVVVSCPISRSFKCSFPSSYPFSSLYWTFILCLVAKIETVISDWIRSDQVVSTLSGWSDWSDWRGWSAWSSLIRYEVQNIEKKKNTTTPAPLILLTYFLLTPISTILCIYYLFWFFFLFLLYYIIVLYYNLYKFYLYWHTVNIGRTGNRTRDSIGKSLTHNR
jgi:hypothetical protein